jgi:hypothetical protein
MIWSMWMITRDGQCQGKYETELQDRVYPLHRAALNSKVFFGAYSVVHSFRLTHISEKFEAPRLKSSMVVAPFTMSPVTIENGYVSRKDLIECKKKQNVHLATSIDWEIAHAHANVHFSLKYIPSLDARVRPLIIVSSKFWWLRGAFGSS